MWKGGDPTLRTDFSVGQIPTLLTWGRWGKTLIGDLDTTDYIKYYILHIHVPYRRKFSRDEIFTNFVSKIAFMKI